jgi:CDP-diacylglycerol--serine O-phosphatidyltransferase
VNGGPLRARPSPADLVTLGNGICGFLALATAGRLVFDSGGDEFDHDTLVTCLLLYAIAMVCDIVDGPLARRLGSSGLGGALDPICDTISFGLLPAVLLIAATQDSAAAGAVVVAACLYVGAMMLRLARFAIATAGGAQPPLDPRTGRRGFRGMPAPVGGNCVLALAVLAPPAAACVALAALVAALLLADFPFPDNHSWGGVFVAGLLAASFAGIAGVISLDIPAAIALAVLVPVALVGVIREALQRPQPAAGRQPS